MKKKFKIIFCLVLALLITLSTAATAFASTVTYKDSAEDFVFSPGSEYSPSDLFTEFKGVMPGDSLTQTVIIKNEKSEKVDIEIFIRALGAVEGSEDFLSQMTLTVAAPSGAKLFEAPASETAQLSDWVSLGKFASGAEVPLTVILNVPIEMGNDFQNAIGELQWQFKVNKTPVNDRITQTGDYFNLKLICGIAAAALVLVLILLFTRRKTEE